MALPKKKRTSKKQKQTKTDQKIKSVDSVDLTRLEFHRHGIALMPATSDDPAVVYSIKEKPGRLGGVYCTCKAKGEHTCSHKKAFSIIFKSLASQKGWPRFTDDFENGPWYHLAVILTDGGGHRLKNTRFSKDTSGSLDIKDMTGKILVTYKADDDSRQRLIDRCIPDDDDPSAPTRAGVLHRLQLLTLSDDERLLLDKGMETRRQAFESSFWYRLAYHCHREYGIKGSGFHTAVDSDRQFRLDCRNQQGCAIFSMIIPPSKVKFILKAVNEAFSIESGPVLGGLSLSTILDVRLNTAQELEIAAMFRRTDADGGEQFYDDEALKQFQFGDLYYFKDLNLFLQNRKPLRLPGFIEKLPMVVPKDQVPLFLLEHGKKLALELFQVDERVQKLKIMNGFDRIQMAPQAMEQNWCWLSVHYGDGAQSVSLGAILAARKSSQRFVATSDGWVDTEAEAFNVLDELSEAVPESSFEKDPEAVRLGRADVLRLAFSGRNRVRLTGDRDRQALLKPLLEMRPVNAMPSPKGLQSTLRGYQQTGAQWLWFLYENDFGGLLCDDMGLGKTHQIMALMVVLCERSRSDQPFLVVCPTSVISHWQQKIADFAPVLNVAIYHGGHRDMANALANADVLVTSYGILRQDAQVLADVAFGLAVFDEIQHLKNSATQVYGAALKMNARIRIGLTGTPIENSVGELKALMDLVVPGYLGSDSDFILRYQNPIEQTRNKRLRQRLSRIISPFTLRRLKKNVLLDLPPKIEDLRTCRLSDEQVKLYRDAIASQGRPLLKALVADDKPVPYIHIFALLNLLKQICNHPALVAGDTAGYENYASGKWDLFTELLEESLDSGQKIVIYSQYLDMIEIIIHHLSQKKVDFAALTGASRNRGKIIARFNQDPQCRVFVGSLKAGGVGIDLVAASVVIHYDRWWNAAKEDQATDRVHRIGQTRGVQVFKLVTLGTLEEKINAIITLKRDLMESIVKEDDPNLVKTFSRQELAGMLAMPDEDVFTAGPVTNPYRRCG